MYDRDAIIAAVDLAALADELLGERRGAARTPAWPCPNPQHAQTAGPRPCPCSRAIAVNSGGDATGVGRAGPRSTS